MKRVISIFFIAVLFVSVLYALTIRDETGYKFTFVSPAKRIISTMPSNTEILFELGLAKKIIAVSNKCDYPEQVKKLPKIGDINLDVEKIISLNPDLIVMLYDTQKYQIERLRKLSLPVFVINPKSFEDLASSILLLGKVTGTEKRAAELNKKIYSSISGIKKAKNSPKVFVVLWANPLITGGKDTIVEDIVKKAGGQNVGSKAGSSYPTVDFEFLLKEDPDYIIFSGKSYSQIKSIISQEKWKQLSAIKKGNFLLIDADLITRPTIRALKSIELIANFIRE